jgi:lysophospholipase L1-like esterase
VFTAATVIALLLGEGVVRLFAPQQLIKPNTGVWRPDNLLGWRHNENVDIVVNTGERPARFVSDHRGYRVNAPGEFPSPARPEFRVLAIGDSFVEGLIVNGEETFVKLIERDLAESGVAAEVINGGVGGWTPRQYLLETQRVLAHERFDAGIVFLYVANDLIREDEGFAVVNAHGRRHHLRWPRSFRHGEVVDAVLYPINDCLETSSHLFVFLKKRGETIASRLGLTAYYFPDVFVRTDANTGRWKNTAEICRRIDDEFQRHGASTVFVLLPTVYQVYEDVFYRYVKNFSVPVDSVDLEQPNRELAEQMAITVDAPFVDLLEPFRERAESGDRLYGKVDRHLNETGHRAVAEELLPIVHDLSAASSNPKEESR